MVFSKQRRLVGVLLFAVAGSVSSLAADGLSGSRPNIILVMTDDQGYGDLSCHGNPFLKTPNLDNLASQSVRLDDYHVSPYCVPTRAALLTGRYADRTGIHNMVAPDWIARADEFMMSTSFRNAGYATGMFGKWHLGDNYPFGPEYHDFDEVLRHYGGAVGVLADYWDNCYVDDTYYYNGKPTKVQGYCTDVFFSAALQFIERAVRGGKPFFIYLPTNAPHGPLICPPEYSKAYAKRKTRSVARFYGMIANIDENVGKLRAYLEDCGLAENTIFIFTTDNGTARGQRLFNANMRGNKGSSYDGGHRVPFFLHWPAGGFDEERRIETLTAHIDVFPTLLDLCGLEKPAGVKMDGTSLRPLLEKGDHPDWPDRMIMTDSQKKNLPTKWATTAVMSERWRLIQGKELYDIDADPGQKNNVFAEHPEVVQRLTRYYDQLWNELEPGFTSLPRIPLTAPGLETVALNYHDCVGRHFGWFQDEMRQITERIDKPQSKRPPAFWPLEVVVDGEYRFELRRWPAEVDAPIHADIPSGGLVYGEKAHRSVPGMGFAAVKACLTIDGRDLTASVDEQTKAAVFQTKLTAGSHRLSARFVAVDGSLLDAFYVYVTKSNGKEKQ
jgi:arylsulfatase B